MINDMLVEAIDMMIDMCSNKQQAVGMSSLREFICGYCEEEWSPLSTEEKYENIKQYLSCKANKIDFE